MPNGDTYGLFEVQDYIACLGLWKYPNPPAMIQHRSDAEYAAALNQCIRVNKARRDYIGKMEVKVAKSELKKLK